MKRFLIVVALSVILGLLMLTAGCSCGGNKNGKKISIAYANWAEGIAMTHFYFLRPSNRQLTLTNQE